MNGPPFGPMDASMLEAVLEGLPIGVAIHRVSDGTAQYVNASFENIYGWPRSYLTSVESFFEHVYPDPTFRREIQQRVLADMASGDPTRMRWDNVTITTQAGERRLVETANIPLLEQDLMISTVVDVTDRAHAEERPRRMSKVFMDAMDPIVIHDLDGTIIEANAEVERAYGWRSARRRTVGSFPCSPRIQCCQPKTGFRRRWRRWRRTSAS